MSTERRDTDDAAVDATRRTHLANERTFLAWWRTGITTILASLAVGRLLPQLADTDESLSIGLGGAFAILGAITMAYGWWRHRAVERALAEGGFEPPDSRLILAISAAGVVLALLTFLLVVVSG